MNYLKKREERKSKGNMNTSMNRGKIVNLCKGGLNYY